VKDSRFWYYIIHRYIYTAWSLSWNKYVMDLDTHSYRNFTNIMVAEPEGSLLLTPKPTIGHDPKPVPTTAHPHNPSP
jgi:hypothetical protein